MAWISNSEEKVPDSGPSGLLSRASMYDRIGLAYREPSSRQNLPVERESASGELALLFRYLWVSLWFGAERMQLRAPRIFGVRIDALSMHDSVDQIVEASQARGRPMRCVSFVNADCLLKARRDRSYHHTLNQSWRVLPDGSGVRLAARILRFGLKDNINGTDLFPVLCERAAEAGVRLFFLGGRPGVAVEAAKQMRARYPKLDVVGCVDGYSESADSERTVDEINRSGADLLLTGFGAPLQEAWLQDHQSRLAVAVGIGVGGLFDYYSGRIRRAPLALREIGMEWVWRIAQEPRAKWRRYVLGNPSFLWHVLKERRVLRRSGYLVADVCRLDSPKRWATMHAKAASQRGSEKRRRRDLTQRLTLAAVAKRMFDIAIAGSALLCLSPLLLLTAAVIKLESRGPVLFEQQRVGLRGKTFSMLKFRSMYCDAEARLAALADANESKGGVLFKMKRDPRITRVGKWIRRFSIDELPQIINVLRGDMAIVGPRPALPTEVQRYTAENRKRLQAKPGLTCYWQIGGRSDLSFKQQVALDCEYLSKQSVTTDIAIVAKTVPAVVSGRGAY